MRIDDLKTLRARTNAGIADCKRALVEAAGDLELAVKHLRRYELERDQQRVANQAAVSALVVGEPIDAAIHDRVATGFYGLDELTSMVGDLGFDHQAVDELTRTAIAAKRADSRDWPAATVCDLLDRACVELGRRKIVVVQNAGFTSSDGRECVEEEARQHPDVIGYCFYTFQDLMTAVRGKGLFLAYGALPDDHATASVGQIIFDVLGSVGLDPAWSGYDSDRISLPNLSWRRRGPELDVPFRRDAGILPHHFCR